MTNSTRPQLTKTELVYSAMITLIDSQQFTRDELYQALDSLLGYRTNGETWDMMKRLAWNELDENGARVK